MSATHPLVRTELPSSVVLETGAGGLPRLRIGTAAASAEIYLHGAHVTAWTPAGHVPVLWLSRASHYAPDKAIRGGVPICFPWFAAHASDATAPAHGFARVLDWTLVDAAENAGDVTLALRLADSPATRSSAWPHRFQAHYRVTAGEALTLSLEVTNTGDEDLSYEEALHTYYAVGDVRRVAVTGLEGASYLDRLGGPQPLRQPAEPVRFDGETDRIFLDTEASTTIEDPVLSRTVTTGKAGSRSTVVWNPWTAKSRDMTDFGDQEWTTMCCVETCNVRDARVRLQPGGRHTTSATIAVTSQSRA
jgi:glucose-6-phosphate 1-epimerase